MNISLLKVAFALLVAAAAAAPGLLHYGAPAKFAYGYAAPAYVAPVKAYVAPVKAYVAPVVKTQVHYVSKPVVVGHNTEIIKPALAAPLKLAYPTVAGPVEKVQVGQVKTVHIAAPLAHAAVAAPLVAAKW